MAFLIVADKAQEIDRRELAGPVVIGRSPECDLPVRDILLSRRHCMIERIGESWFIADLGSKNGTRVNGEPITRQVLKDGDVVRLGRTRIGFREGPFVPAPPTLKPVPQRAANPIEALSGTMAAFQFTDEDEEKLDKQVLESFPRPKPRPAEPRAFKDDKVYSMLAEITSSAWDSILTGSPQRSRTVDLPRPMIENEPIPAPPSQIQLSPTIDLAKSSKPPKDILALFYVIVAVLLVAASVWVISWGW